jgi:hypothetical protein
MRSLVTLVVITRSVATTPSKLRGITQSPSRGKVDARKYGKTPAALYSGRLLFKDTCID